MAITGIYMILKAKRLDEMTKGVDVDKEEE